MGISERDQPNVPNTTMADRLRSAFNAREKREIFDNPEVTNLLAKPDKSADEEVEAELIRFAIRSFDQRMMGADLPSLKRKKNELEEHIRNLGADNPTAQEMASLYNEVFPDRIAGSAKGAGAQYEKPEDWRMKVDPEK